MKSWDVCSQSPEQTFRLGKLLGQLCAGEFAILLEGDLGSGKTCLVQGLARGLDVSEDVPVNSPTYTLMNQYSGRFEIAHFDLYRLGSPDELIELDFDSYLYGDGITVVEWAGMVAHQGVRGLLLCLEYGATEDERIIRISALDPSGEETLQLLAESWKEN